jgi:NAD(P)-dependent dehydrogenase (short-subunit alcohol dehydrogenase family)
MKNKTILITGSAKRIGREIALFMAKNGWNVAIHYNNSQIEAEELVQEIKILGVNACAVKADLNNEGEVNGVIAAVNAEIGEIDALVNNASYFKNDNLSGCEKKIWDMHMNINLYSAVIVSKYFVSQLNNKAGNIINMLDYCVWNLPDKFLSYSTSKYALWGVTQMLAKTLAPNVRVNAIGPGHSLPNEFETIASFELAKQKTPLRNGASPNEICKAIEFILDSPSITGQMLALDGGKHLIGAEFY